MSTFLLNDQEKRLLTEIQRGFPLVPRPFQHIGKAVGMTEEVVLASLQALQQRRVIKRMGIIVRHHELGYRANAMVVWDLPDPHVQALGKKIITYPFVTLCYQRERSLPHWPYNLYCMIHGKERREVRYHLKTLIDRCDLENAPSQILFSLRRFKQRGACHFRQKDNTWQDGLTDLLLHNTKKLT